MDGRTRSYRRTLALTASALLAGACHRDGGVIGTSSLPNIEGKFVIEDDDRTTALTSVQHSIYYEIGNSRKLIFHGAGGTTPVLSLLGPDDILIRYCGGWIYKVESQFFEKEGKDVRVLRLIRVQPVTSSGLAVNGQMVCPPHP